MRRITEMVDCSRNNWWCRGMCSENNGAAEESNVMRIEFQITTIAKFLKLRA